MARRDKIHDAVETALRKDGWQVSDDPLLIYFDIYNQPKVMKIDLGIEKGAAEIITANKNSIRIAVEIKSFSNSMINDFHTALGQTLNYRLALKWSEYDSDRELYIALPEEAYNEIIESRLMSYQVKDYDMKFVIVDINTQKVIGWTK